MGAICGCDQFCSNLFRRRLTKEEVYLFNLRYCYEKELRVKVKSIFLQHDDNEDGFLDKDEVRRYFEEENVEITDPAEMDEKSELYWGNMYDYLKIKEGLKELKLDQRQWIKASMRLYDAVVREDLEEKKGIYYEIYLTEKKEKS